MPVSAPVGTSGGIAIRYRVFALCVLSILPSCTAYRTPRLPELDPPSPKFALGTAVIDRSTLPASLTDEQIEEFYERLHADLVASGLFQAVVVDEGSTQATIVVHPIYSERHCLSEPMLTVLTLGVIPHPGCYYSGYHLTLRSDRFARDVVIDNRSTPLFLWGWIAGPIGLLPGWSWTWPTERERELLRQSIATAVRDL